MLSILKEERIAKVPLKKKVEVVLEYLIALVMQSSANPCESMSGPLARSIARAC